MHNVSEVRHTSIDEREHSRSEQKDAPLTAQWAGLPGPGRLAAPTTGFETQQPGLGVVAISIRVDLRAGLLLSAIAQTVDPRDPRDPPVTSPLVW